VSTVPLLTKKSVILGYAHRDDPGLTSLSRETLQVQSSSEVLGSEFQRMIYLFIFWGAGDWTHDFIHSRQVLQRWGKLPVQHMFMGQTAQFLTNGDICPLILTLTPLFMFPSAVQVSKKPEFSRFWHFS
jgi:hypothetical protein